MHFRNFRREHALLLVILLVAAFVRLWRLDLMEFKGDEAEACRLAYHVFGDPLPDGSNKFPVVGLTASVGVHNPPLFIYLVALPLACWRSPYAAVIFIAMSNVVAVWLCYCVGRRYFSQFVGLAASALFALSPWAIVFSRKIWAQDLLPVFACLFLLVAHRFLVDKKPGMAAWLIVLAGAAIQVHFSALILLGVLIFIFIAGRETFRWQWFWVGVAATLVLYAPYLAYLVVSHGADFADLANRREQWGGDASFPLRLLRSIRYALAVSSVDFTQYLTGISRPCTLVLSLATGVACLAGLFWQCFHDRARPLFRARLMLLIWFVLPVLGLVVVGTTPYPHYFVILYPLPFLGLAVALERMGEKWRGCGTALLSAILLGYTLFDSVTFRTITERGGGAADYGIAYTYKVAAIDFILKESNGRPFAISSDFDSKAKVPQEYSVLLWLEMRKYDWSATSSSPAQVFVLLNTFASKLSPEGESAVRELRRQDFGPLAVFVVPLQPKSN